MAQSIEDLVAERGSDYSHPKNDFSRSSEYITTYLRHKGKLAPGQVIDMFDIPFIMMFVKITREEFKHKTDNLDDIQGYAKTAGMLYE